MDLNARVGRVIRLDGFLMAILLGSLAANVYLGTRARTAPPVQPRPELLASGTKAPAIEGTTLAGVKFALDFKDQRPTLLYVFSPTCRWCEKNLANIKAIIDRRQDLRVVGLNIGPKLDPDVARTLPFHEIVTPSTATLQAYHFTGTPSTILITGGVVDHAWSGAYAGPVAAEVSAALAVSLPGLIEQTPR